MRRMSCDAQEYRAERKSRPAITRTVGTTGRGNRTSASSSKPQPLASRPKPAILENIAERKMPGNGGKVCSWPGQGIRQQPRNFGEDWWGNALSGTKLLGSIKKLLRLKQEFSLFRQQHFFAGLVYLQRK